MTPDARARIACVVPVYDEAAAVGDALRGVRDALAASGETFRLIVVDDGSTDGSGRVAREAVPECEVLTHDENRGYGAALKTGIRAARDAEWILIVDADGSYPPEDVAKLLRTLREEPLPESLDMIVGARRQTTKTDPLARVAAKRMLGALANFLAGRKIPDFNSGLRLMRTSEVRRHWAILPNGFSLTTTMTLALLCSGSLVRFVPIDYRRREGNSKIRPVRDMWNFVVLMLRTMILFRPLKVFAPLAGLLVAAAVGVAVASELVPPYEVMDVTALFLFIAGLQMLLVGVLADLILRVSARADP